MVFSRRERPASCHVLCETAGARRGRHRAARGGARRRDIVMPVAVLSAATAAVAGAACALEPAVLSWPTTMSARR